MYHSQVGQDYVVISTFSGRRNGTFVDLAANDPIVFSNTRTLERDFGWTGTCVEPQLELVLSIARRRLCRVVHAVVSDDEDGSPVPFQLGRTKGKEGQSSQHVYSHVVKTTRAGANASKPGVTLMPPVTLRRILEEVDAPRTIDFLSLDVEGSEDAALLPALPYYTFHALVVEGPSKKLTHALSAHGYSAAITKLGRYTDQLWVHRFLPGGAQAAGERANAAWREWQSKTHHARMSHGVRALQLKPPDSY